MKDLKTTFGRFEPWRLMVFYAAIGILFTFYTFRLFSLQILRRADFLGQAVENYTKEQIIPAPRGIIYDRNGIGWPATQPATTWSSPRRSCPATPRNRKNQEPSRKSTASSRHWWVSR